MDIIVDTISFRANFDTYENFVDFLGIFPDDWDKFETSDKRFNMNYSHSYFYEGIRIGFDGQAGWEYYIHMSGKGCRTFEDIQGDGFDWFKFILKLYLKVRNGSATLTRIDIACDDLQGIFDINTLEKSIEFEKYLSRCTKKSIRLVKFGEECLYVGSTQSLALLRIYNKKLERGYDPGDKEIPHWWRCELQLRDEHAQQVVCEWAETQNIGKVYTGHVLKHIRFLTKPNRRDGTQHRINTATWWKAFLGDAEKIEWVSSKGSEYNMTKLQKYAIGNAGSSIQTMIKAKNLNAEQLFSIYTDEGIKLREDQKAFIRAHGGVI